MTPTKTATPSRKPRAPRAASAADAAPALADRVVPSPLGPLRVLADDHALRRLEFPNRPRVASSVVATAAQRAVLEEVARQLGEYFAGTRRVFELPLHATGTEFQQRVWSKLRVIPYAETWSYGELATEVGNRNASRAVGAANGQNPLGIIVPCHRVIGADGSLTGFGGGEPAKRWLLDHEARVAGLRLL